MIKQTWVRGTEEMVIGLHPQREWIYLFKDGAFWIKGWTFEWLIENGWKRKNETETGQAADG